MFNCTEEEIKNLSKEYLNFLEFQGNSFVIPNNNASIVYIPENAIYTLIENIKYKGYRNFNLLEILKKNSEELCSKIWELIDQVETESDIKIGFAFPVFLSEDKKYFVALVRYELSFENEKLLVNPKEINNELIDKISDKKIEVSREDNTKEISIFEEIIGIITSLSTVINITLPEPISTSIAFYTFSSSLKKFLKKFRKKTPTEPQKDSQTDSQDLYGIIYFYKEKNYYERIKGDIKNIFDNLNHEGKKKISKLFNYENHKYEKIDLEDYRYSLINYELTESQKKAYEEMLIRDFCLIQGPPGTGKTQLIVTFCADMILKGNKKVVVTSTNNKAVDNVYNKLSTFDEYNQKKLKTNKLLKGYIRLGKKEFINKFCWEILNFKNETEKYNINMIENIVKELEEETKILEDFISTYKKLKIFDENLPDISDCVVYFTNKKSLSSFSKESLNILSSLINKLNRFWIRIIPYAQRRIIRRIHKFCIQQDIKLPSLQNIDNINYRDIYIKELETLKKLSKVIFYNEMAIKKEKLKHKFEELIEKVHLITNSNEDIDKLYNTARTFYYLRKRELNYWNLAKDIEWKNKVSDNEKNINGGKLWGLEDVVFKYASVVITTSLSSSSVCKPEPEIIDYVIVDEASQTLFCHTFPLYFRAKNFSAIGDDNQLGPVLPTLKFNAYLKNSPIPEYLSAEKSVFEALDGILNKNKLKLREHYRCKKPIIEFCDKLIGYGLEIKTDEKTIEEITSVDKCFSKNIAFVHVDGKTEGKESKWNQREINFIVNFIEKLKIHINLKEIGVIAPYRAHIDRLRKALPYNDLTIGTVHTYQGDERDIIIFSCVCTRHDEFIRSPLLRDKKLINVAVSRAKKHLIVVGNQKAIEKLDDTSQNPIKELYNYISKVGVLICAD